MSNPRIAFTEEQTSFNTTEERWTIAFRGVELTTSGGGGAPANIRSGKLALSAGQSTYVISHADITPASIIVCTYEDSSGAVLGVFPVIRTPVTGSVTVALSSSNNAGNFLHYIIIP